MPETDQPIAPTAESLRDEVLELVDEVEGALEEHVAFSARLATRVHVEQCVARYRAFLATLDEKERTQIERTLGRKIVDLQRVASRLPAPPAGQPAAKRVDTGFFETRAPSSSRAPRTIGADPSARVPTAKYRVSGDVEAWCGPCDRLTTHVIVAMVGDTPAQVVCDVCGGRHKFRTTPARARKDATPAARPGAARTPVDPEAARRAKEKKELLESLAAAETVRPFVVGERYRPGEVISHPEHGRGKIENVLQRSMLVRFPSGLKSVKIV